MKKIEKSDQDWQARLTPEQFHVCREKGTEPPFTGKYHDTKDKGVYTCVCCGNELFESDTKFDSGTGWPSFYRPMASENVSTETDNAYGMSRVEVMCGACGSHSDTSFLTARIRRECATASIPRLSIWTRKTADSPRHATIRGIE